MKPELYGLPIRRAKGRMPDYARGIRSGRLRCFGRLDSRLGAWAHIEPSVACGLHLGRGGCWKREGCVVWDVHVHDTVGVPLDLAWDLYGEPRLEWEDPPGQDDLRRWLDRELEAGHLVRDGELVRQLPPPLPDWPPEGKLAAALSAIPGGASKGRQTVAVETACQQWLERELEKRPVQSKGDWELEALGQFGGRERLNHEAWLRVWERARSRFPDIRKPGPRPRLKTQRD